MAKKPEPQDPVSPRRNPPETEPPTIIPPEVEPPNRDFPQQAPPDPEMRVAKETELMIANALF